MAVAEVTVEGTFTTSAQTHNPLGPFTTMAHWDGGTLTVFESTQNPFLVPAVLAGSFRLAEEKVRVLSPFVGGGFGAGLRPGRIQSSPPWPPAPSNGRFSSASPGRRCSRSGLPAQPVGVPLHDRARADVSVVSEASVVRGRSALLPHVATRGQVQSAVRSR